MDAAILVSAHASALSPSQPTSIPVHTARNTPLPADLDKLSELAVYSSVFNSPNTGTLLLRVLHDGLILELLSLSTDVPPLRFVFPALILNAPAIFAWHSTELHVLVVTNAASLYRLVIPVGTARRLWKEDTGNIWIREYLIKTAPADLVGPVHVQGVHCLAIGLTHGALLRIETESLGSGDQQGKLNKSILKHTECIQMSGWRQYSTTVRFCRL